MSICLEALYYIYLIRTVDDDMCKNGDFAEVAKVIEYVGSDIYLSVSVKYVASAPQLLLPLGIDD